MPATQRITFTASAAYLSDPAILNTALNIVKAAQGYISCFHGLQIDDDGKTVYFIGMWKSSKAYDAFVQGATYPDFVSALDCAVEGDLEIYSFEHDAGDLTVPLVAPVTELALFSMKAGIKSEDTLHVFRELARGLDGAPGAHAPCCWAPSRECESKISVDVGWDSIEAHLDAVKEGTELHKLIQAVLEKKESVVGGHAHLVKEAGRVHV
ncbi:hypothetical protein K438DRAFT_1987245 [Mycena galopus ATCC 62051]|nr:hypothetical protein K438DRAFT_1987245 [Mycena galopus ATCC 62051]